MRYAPAADATSESGGTRLTDPGEPLICEDCGQATADTRFCVRCGHELGTERKAAARRRFSAGPNEAAVSLSVVSTLFPQLPRDEMTAFRTCLVVGIAAVVALGVAGAFPVALIAAAVLVPLVMVVYLYDVDVYEDEPLRVYLFTFLWGAVTGAIVGLALRSLVDIDPLGSGPDGAFLIARGVVVPLVAGALMLAGPLVLLRYRRFNDILDGATFGATSATAFVGAQVIAQSIDLLRGGLFPGGDPLSWTVRLLIQGVALPLIAGGAIGAVCAALWLQYRAPVRDRDRLSWLGRPVVAIVYAAVLLVVAELARLLLRETLALVVLAVLAAVALIWLRLVIHAGLIQESLEIEVGSEIRCGNCGQMTPAHTFCGNCGVSLQALPKERGRHAAAGAGGTSSGEAEATR
jgi:ribosomal protein L32